MIIMKAVIFDMDGLMVDSERLYFQSEREIARKFGKEVKDETLWRMMGRKPVESLALFARELELPVTAEELFIMRTEIMRRRLKEDLQPMPGLFSVIDALYGKVKLSVATGAQKEFMDIIVDTLNLRTKFDVLQASDDIRQGKPDPEIYLVTCRKLRVEPKDSVVLEDSLNGVIAGYRAGCYVIAVPSEYTKNHDLSLADYKAKDLFEAGRHILQILN